MLSLAAVRYRNVLEADGGPIANLTTRLVVRRDRAVFEANASLRRDLMATPSSFLFAEVDGSGTNAIAAVARHIAISEAIERWAVYEGLSIGGAVKWGLSVDPTSNGFAAFPGIVTRQARRLAWLEAVERWCLFAWWEGWLGADVIALQTAGVSGIRIRGPFPCVVVVLFAQTSPGSFAYGYAAGEHITAAIGHALIELDRHAVAMKRAVGAAKRRLGRHEARAMFFASAEGFALFQERVARSELVQRTVDVPSVIYDGEILGEWSEYADVWRVLFQPPSNRHLLEAREYFWW